VGIECGRPGAAANGDAEDPQSIDGLPKAVARSLGRVVRPEQVRDFVARHFATRLGAIVQREPELQFGLGRQANPTRVDFGLSEYAAANRGERH